MSLTLLPEWRDVLRRAWSIWLLALSALLIFASVALMLLDARILGLPPLVFAGLAGLTNVLAIPARLIAQTRIVDFLLSEDGALRLPRSRRGRAAGAGGAASAVILFAPPSSNPGKGCA